MSCVRKTIKDCQELAIKKNGKCLSKEYKGAEGPLLWECGMRHKWKTSYHSINKGTWCPFCNKRKPKTIKDAKRIATKNKGKCLSIEINGNNKKHLRWQCYCGYEWMASYNNVSRGTWCPKCNKNNKTEQKVREIFEKVFKKPFIKCKILDLKSNLGWPLEFDGYCEELKIAFEYDGEFHFKPWDDTRPETLQKTLANDALKNEWCLKQGIKLIRIPYTEKRELEQYILKKIKEL